MHYDKSKASLALKKSQGTLEKVQTLINEDAYCPDIIQQLDAAIGLIKSARKELLSGHLDHCLEVRLHQDKHQTIKELLKIYELGSK